MVNPHFLIFRITEAAPLVPPGVDAQKPRIRRIQSWECDGYILPVRVYRYIHKVILFCVRIVSGKAYAKCFGIFWDGHILRIGIVRVDRIHSAYGVRKLLADHRMAEAIVDHEFEKRKQLPVFLQKIPIQPGDLIVLTVGVVVAGL